MLNDTFWFAMGVAATLLTAFVMQRNGRLQISLMSKTHELHAKLAKPKISCSIKLQPQNVVPGQGILRYFVFVSIHNDGDLPAQKVQGDWKLSCPFYGHKETIPIDIEYLRGNPHNFDPVQLTGNAITTAIKMGDEVAVNVEIEFSYFGFSEQKPEQYSAKYKYDSSLKQMVRLH